MIDKQTNELLGARRIRDAFEQRVRRLEMQKYARALQLVDLYRCPRDMGWALLPRLAKLERVREAVAESGLRIEDVVTLIEGMVSLDMLIQQSPAVGGVLQTLLGDDA